VASSTTDGNIWKATSNTFSNKAFSSQYIAAAGVYFIAILYSSSAQTTAPALAAIPSVVNSAVFVGDFTNSSALVGQASSITALPSPTQAMSGLTQFAAMRWLALY